MEGDSKRTGRVKHMLERQIFKSAGIWLHPLLMIGLSQCLLGQLS